MRSTKLSTIARWAGGSLLRGVPSALVSSVSTDTRSLKAGSVFVALSGENFDAHNFLDAAVEAGAAVLVVSRLTAFTETCDAAVIHVENTLTALQDLARNYRRSLSGLRVIGVTGSNGKTSTKDLIGAALGDAGSVSATLGNLNNHIGLPLTILAAEPEHTAAVWEMGMSNPGEIEVLAEIAAPDMAVITNVGTAHIEFMHTREAIAEEKGMLVEAIDLDGCVFLNASDDYAEALAKRSRARVVTSGIGAGDVQGENLRPSVDGTVFDLVAGDQQAEVCLPIAGRHMVGNALLAAAVALELGSPIDTIASNLSQAQLTGGRLQRRCVGGLEFLDDSYNANPDSMRAALATLVELETEGRHIAVLGRMAELGGHEEEEHRQLGAAVAKSGIDVLIGVGDAGGLVVAGAEAEAASGLVAEHCSDQESAAQRLKELAKKSDLILVKGSRSAAMEAVIRAFEG